MEEFIERMREEHSELVERTKKLQAALEKEDAKEKVGNYQYELMKMQLHGMKEYLLALTSRLTALGWIINDNFEIW